MAGLDIDRFLTHSRAVDLSDIDWDEAARTGVTDEEVQIVRYMADTEIHTPVYMRDLLAGHTAQERDVRAFMACWAYEETHHGLALERFLATVGYPPQRGNFRTLTGIAALREGFEAMLSTGAARLTPHFAAVHMAWGALNEATAAATYTALARSTQNRPLARLVTKLARDERRHYSFYYWQAEKRLAHPMARFLCRRAFAWLWGPVGVGVGGSREVIDRIIAKYFVSGEGREEFQTITDKMRELPGLEGFDALSRLQDECVRSFSMRHPAEFARYQRAAENSAAAPTAASASGPYLSVV